VVVFTASMQQYAEKVLDLGTSIDWNGVKIVLVTFLGCRCLVTMVSCFKTNGHD
jgi:hypothetical protein